MHSITIYDTNKLQQKTFVVVCKLFSDFKKFDRVSLFNKSKDYQGFKTIVDIKTTKLKNIDNHYSFLDKDCIKETYLDIMQSFNFNLNDDIAILTLSTYTSPQTILDHAYSQ